jgi:hypothetical protein
MSQRKKYITGGKNQHHQDTLNFDISLRNDCNDLTCIQIYTQEI